MPSFSRISSHPPSHPDLLTRHTLQYPFISQSHSKLPATPILTVQLTSLLGILNIPVREHLSYVTPAPATFISGTHRPEAARGSLSAGKGPSFISTWASYTPAHTPQLQLRTAHISRAHISAAGVFLQGLDILSSCRIINLHLALNILSFLPRPTSFC